MRLLLVGLVALVCGVSSYAKAQDDLYVRHLLPPGKRILLDGEEYQAYNFDEFLLLLQMDSNLHHCKLQRSDLQAEVKLLEEAVTEYQEALKHAKTAEQLAYDETERLNSLYVNTVKDYSTKLERTKRRSRIGWSAAVVSLAAFVLSVAFGG